MAKLVTQVFTAVWPAINTWTCPAGVTKVLLIGQGGGQGGTGGAGISNVVAPGGNGTTPYLVEVDVVPNTTYTITIGSGGSSVAGSNAGIFVLNGKAGEDTTFGNLYTFKGARYVWDPLADLKGLVCAPATVYDVSSPPYYLTGSATGYAASSGYLNTISTSVDGSSNRGGAAGAPGFLGGAGGGQGGNGSAAGTGAQGLSGSGRGAGGGGGGAGSVKGGSGWQGGPGQLQIGWIE